MNVPFQKMTLAETTPTRVEGSESQENITNNQVKEIVLAPLGQGCAGSNDHQNVTWPNQPLSNQRGWFGGGSTPAKREEVLECEHKPNIKHDRTNDVWEPK